MGILRRFREWREDKDGVLTGPDINADSLSTDDAEINNAPSGDDDVLRFQEGAEIGQATANGVNNSTGNDDWGQSTTNSTSITFNNSFASTPKVNATKNSAIDNIKPDEYTFQTFNISTTGVEVQFAQMSATDNSAIANAYGVDLIATGGR